MEFDNYKELAMTVARNTLENVLKGKSKEIKEIEDDKENKKSLIFEFARYGENYFQNDKVRLMVVGRATGEFKQPKEQLSVIKRRENDIYVSKEQIEKCFNDYHNEHLNWIHTKAGKRYIDSKPFFGFSKNIYAKLTGEDDNPEWYKNICYTNLCKIISIGGGNPSEKLKKIQLENGMLELLKIEIDYYKPTHILVLDSATEDHSWSSKELKDVIKKYAFNHNPKIKICFSDRPEFREYKALKKKVLMEFGKE